MKSWKLILAKRRVSLDYLIATNIRATLGQLCQKLLEVYSQTQRMVIDMSYYPKNYHIACLQLFCQL